MFGSLGIPAWHAFVTASDILSVECSAATGRGRNRIKWGTIIVVEDWVGMSI